MSNLLVAALFLIGTHFGISSTQLRDQLVAAVGERAYLALYSLIALVAIVWLVMAWREAPWIELWASGAAVRHLPILVMPFALLFLVCGVSRPNPTAVGQAPDPDATDTVHGILRITRHPVMWGVALWALSHLLAKGDVASVVFFGTFAVLALLGARLIDAKRSRRNEPGWGVFLQATSGVPLLAIVERRQRFVAGEIGLARVVAALGLYLVLLIAHPWLFGVAALPG